MPEPTIGFIGLQNPHTRPYLESLAQLPVELVGVCEPDDTYEDESFDGLPVYRDPETLFEEREVDIAWVTLPNRDTPRVVETAVRAGVDVFSEKTMACTAADLEPVCEAVAASDVTVAVAYTKRVEPAVNDIRRWIDEGVIGVPRAIDLRVIAKHLDQRLDSGIGRYVYMREPSRGGILQWLGCHLIDVVEFILKEPIVRVNAALTYNHDEADAEDGATMTFETESGAIGALVAGYYLQDGADADVSVYGSAGACRWIPMSSGSDRGPSAKVTVDSFRESWNVAPARTVEYGQESAPGYGGRSGLMFIKQFLAAREGEAPIPAGIEAARRVLLVLDAAYESARCGEWVEVGD